MGDVSKNPRTTARTLVNDLAESGIVVLKKKKKKFAHEWTARLQTKKNWDSRQGGQNHQERRLYEDFERKPQAVSSRSGSWLCLPTRQLPKTYVAPGEELHKALI